MTRSSSLRLVASSHFPMRRTVAAQKSPAISLAARRMKSVPVADKAGFMAWWAGVLRRRCGADAVEISRTFSVTEQTGRNWLTEFACPMGHHLDLAMALWPAEFAARYGVEPQRRAA